MKNEHPLARLRAALESEHRALDDRLRMLTRRPYMTPTEQREAQEIKRRKLSAKDRLVALKPQ